MRILESGVLIPDGVAALLVPLIDADAYRQRRGKSRELDDAISDLARAAADWTTLRNLRSVIGTEVAPNSELPPESCSCQRSWTTAQLAERFGVTSRRVLQWRPNGVGRQIGRRWLFTDADVAAIKAVRGRR